MAALPAIIYPAKFLNISISEHEDLFRPLDRFLRQIAEVKTSFPRALLYMRHNEGGLRLMDIIMQIQKLKQRMLQRAFKLESPAKQASKAIIERCYRQSVLHSNHQPLGFGPHIKSWIGSMLEYNHTSAIILSKHLQSVGDNPPIQMLAKPEYIDLVCQLAAETEVDSLRDITTTSNENISVDSNRTILLNHPIYPYLEHVPTINGTTQHIVRRGRLYLLVGSQIIEYLGQHGNNILIREWLTDKEWSKKQKTQSNSSDIKWTTHFSTRLQHPPEVNDRVRLAEHPNYMITIEQPLVSAFLALITARVHCEGIKNSKGHVKATRVAIIVPNIGNPKQRRSETN